MYCFNILFLSLLFLLSFNCFIGLVQSFVHNRENCNLPIIDCVTSTYHGNVRHIFLALYMQHECPNILIKVCRRTFASSANSEIIFGYTCSHVLNFYINLLLVKLSKNSILWLFHTVESRRVGSHLVFKAGKPESKVMHCVNKAGQ